MYRYTKFSLLAIAIAATGAVAYAASGGMENDAMAITKAKIPLTQAVAAADSTPMARRPEPSTRTRSRAGFMTWKSSVGPKSSMSGSMPTRARSSHPPRTRRIAMTTTTSKTDIPPAYPGHLGRIRGDPVAGMS